MKDKHHFWASALHLLRHATFVAAGFYLYIASSPVVWAAKKKVEEVAAPTKSYTVPYMIVLAFLGLGLMTICRPSARKEKQEDNLHKTKDKEEE